MEINKYLESLVFDREECQRCTNRLENEGFEYFRKEHLGFIEEKTLIMLIQKSHEKILLQRFLASFAYCLTAEEVTPQIFTLFLKYKGKYKETILMALSHCHLSIYQLQILMQLNIDEQAFCQLVLIYCKYDCFSKQDLINLLQENSCNKNQLPNLYDEMLNDKTFADMKIQILKLFIKNETDG